MQDPAAYQQACEAITRVTAAWADGMTLEQIRTSFERFLHAVGGAPTRAVRQTPCMIDTLPACWFTPENLLSHKPLLYCHGGGFQIGSIRSHSALMGRLAEATGMRVLGFDYRLAPEHRAPAAAEDTWTLYQRLVESGDRPLALVGDSAGGALALGAMLKARDAQLLLPQALVLLSPWLDLSMSGASYQDLAACDVFSKPEHLRAMARTYAGRGTDYSNASLSPVFADLHGLPPVLIHAGGHDITLDDARLLHQRATAAGTRVELNIFPTMFHHFQIFAALPEATRSLAEIGAFLKGIAANSGSFA